MKIQDNITVFAGIQENIYAEKSSSEHSSKENAGEAVFAGDFQGNISLQERIAQRREQAQRQAMKLVKDAWEGDCKIEEELNNSRQRIRDLRQENKEAQQDLRDIEAQSAALKEEYGITDDCEEAQELELLRRRRAAMNGEGDFSAEEWKRSFEIEADGLTEYQQRQLELDERAEHNQRTIEKNDREIEIENAVIRGIREERRKVHPVSDARKQAEAVIEAAGEEIISMVVEDGKEKVDLEQEEREERAEAIEEKREEQEELIREQREENRELEELTEELPVDGMLELEQIQSKVQAQVQNIVNKMKLVAEDIKGAAVDTNV